MSDVKRLLAEATPRPWEIYPAPRPGIEAKDFSVVVYGGVEENDFDGVARQEDAALIVYAVNHLPDYEAAVEALALLLGDLDREDIGAMDPQLWGSHGVARAALARLRESALA